MTDKQPFSMRLESDLRDAVRELASSMKIGSSSIVRAMILQSLERLDDENKFQLLELLIKHRTMNDAIRDRN